MIRMDLDGLALNDSQPDENGCFWYVTGFEGWDGVPLRTNMTTGTNQPGGFLTENIPDMREITVSGVTKTSGGEEGFWHAYNRLAGISSSLMRPGTFTVFEPTPKYVSFVRSGSPRIDIGISSFEWEFSMVCPDPFKYSLEEHVVDIPVTNWDIDVFQHGNYASPMILTTGADSTSPAKIANTTVLNGFRAFEVTGLLSGSVINSKTRTVKQPGGVNGYPRVNPEFNRFLYLDPGINHVHNYSGIPHTLRFRDVWM